MVPPTLRGWSSGNALAFIVTGTGHRTAESFDKSGGNPARLNVNFVSPSATYNVSATVSSGTNDAEQSASGAVNLTSTDLEMVNDAAGGAADQIVGLRFENLAVPPGAVIASAKIQFSADEAQSEAMALTIRALIPKGTSGHRFVRLKLTHGYSLL